MTLGLNTQMNDGESQFLPIVKFMAEAGRFFKIDRISGASGFEKIEVELPVGTKFAMDFGSIEVGFLAFLGGRPDWLTVPFGQKIPERPSKDHRQAFKMKIHLGKQGGVREFGTNTKTVLGPVDELHTTYEGSPEAREGKIPVVEWTGTTMLTSKGGIDINGVPFPAKKTFRPELRIVSWIDRPADLGERTVAPPGQPHLPPSGQSMTAASGAQAARQQMAARSNGSSNGSAPVDDGSAAHEPEGIGRGGGAAVDDLNDSIPFGPEWR